MPCKPVNVSSSGDNPLGIAAAGKTIRVHGLALTAAGAVTLTVKAGSTILAGPMSLTTGLPLVLPHARNGWWHFDSQGPNVDLVLTLGGAVQVGGHVDYEQF
jgi:hypothetical protein